MKNLRRTTAIAAVLSCFAFAANAQQASYCDKPWSKVDGNSDGVVSKQEASAAIENQFGQIDSDGNGEITKVEWITCMGSIDQQAATKTDRDKKNFAEADTDQDSKIDREEFRKGAEQAFQDTESGDADEDALVVLRRYVFLTPEEGQDQSTLENMSEDEAAGRSALTFSALDQNDDDSIDQQEWSERSPKIKRDEDWANAQFNEIDGDGTGSITQEEYRTARQQMLDDQLTTGSTESQGEASAEGSAAKSESASDSGDGIPVYIYRFWTM